MRYAPLQELYAERLAALRWIGSGHFKWRSSEAIVSHNRRVKDAAEKKHISKEEERKLKIPF